MAVSNLLYIEETNPVSAFYKRPNRYTASPSTFEDSDTLLKLPTAPDSAKPSGELTLNNASFFSNVQIVDVSKVEEIVNRQFGALVCQRLNYLDSLRNLGDGWISGNSRQPSDSIIDVAKKILTYLRDWLKLGSSTAYLPPLIVMGPIPAGGVSYEFVISSEAKAYVNIYNDGHLEMEMEIDGYYAEIAVPSVNSVLNKLIEILTKYGYDYTGWGNPVSVC